MQIKLINVTGTDAEALDELNRFLRHNKVMEISKEFALISEQPTWCFCIRYIHDSHNNGKNSFVKTDYKTVLDHISFEKFSKLREMRKTSATEEAIPAFAVFTDDELAQISRLSDISQSALQSIPGISQKKASKYIDKIISTLKAMPI